MVLSAKELAEARHAAELLLDDLGIEAYLFEVEPLEVAWKVYVECAVAEGWQSLAFPVDKAKLLESLGNPRLREQLRESWRKELANCKSQLSNQRRR